MEPDNAMERLQGLQRDLSAFADSRIPNVERLLGELKTSVEDFKKLLEKKRRNAESRNEVNPTATPKPATLKIEGVEYKVTEDFRQAALQVADELDLDEIQAAKLCIDAGAVAEHQSDNKLPYRALVRFQNQRCILLDCVRLLFQQSLDLDAGDALGLELQQIAHNVIRGQCTGTDGGSSYWKKCMDALAEVEEALKKVLDHKQTVHMTDQSSHGDMAEALSAQRMLLSRQHECLGAIMSYLVRGAHVSHTDFRALLTRATGLDGAMDMSIHYLPVIISGSAYFGGDGSTTSENSKDIHRIFAAGPGQIQWKQSTFGAAATVCWLAEYSSRFSDPTADPNPRVADRQKEEEERSKLFLDSVKAGAFKFILATCDFLKPEIWLDPMKAGFVRHVLAEAPHVSDGSTNASSPFAELVMDELQVFSDAFVANMPDVLRRLKVEEDEQRRNQFSDPGETAPALELDLERFLLIVSYAYQDDADAAQDFWSDRDGNLYGFLRWASQRLPTPRVAAFCELLLSIASDEKSGNQAHLFLREETSMASGKLRKLHSVSWAQIFAELEFYSSSVKNRPANLQQAPGPDANLPVEGYAEAETPIMLETYLRLASHICRISPDARNWILREQPVHIAEILLHLASAGRDPRIHGAIFGMLSALLTDKIPEVSDGMWVLLDSWIAGGGPAGAIAPRVGRQPHSERHYLHVFARNMESATGLVNLLNALVSSPRSQDDVTNDALPFPENLGAPNRHGGIDAYVDFVFNAALKLSTNAMIAGEDRQQVDVLRYACLQFVCICLSSFNEDLVALANVAGVSVDSSIRTSSLRAYARLHPFARVMDWMFNNHIISAVLGTAEQDIDELNSMDQGSPRVQATLRAVQAMNLAMRLQASYFDIVRPLINSQSSGNAASNANTALASYDEVLLGNLDVISDIASFTASSNADLCLESLSLIQKLCASRKMSDTQHSEGGRVRLGSRVVGKISERAEAIALEIQPYFEIFEWDVESGEQPFKLIKAQAVLDVLNSSLDTSGGRPALAHCLLGFRCQHRTVEVEPGSAFSQSQSLFHMIAACAAQAPWAIGESNVSWLLGIKRGCLDVILKLVLSPLTASIVLPELGAMEFLAAASQNQILAVANPFWDKKPLQEQSLLLDGSASAVRDFMFARADFFQYAALEMRTANDTRAFSAQEKIMSVLLGIIKVSPETKEPTNSAFDLFDFFDINIPPASDASCMYLRDVDLTTCMEDDPDTVTAFDVTMAEQVLVLKKRELINAGTVKEAMQELQVDDEIRATLASLTSQNNWRAIQGARITALEAWTDLLSLMVTTTGLEDAKLASVALQGLQVVLPRFERALVESLDAAALLAKLTLTLVPAASAGSTSNQARSASLAHERLLAAFRVCLKVITDSGTGLALRDICYRICCAILTSLPLTVVNGQTAPSPNAKQLLQLVHGAGERLIAVVTEDAFSGRGVTRVSSLLFLDGLVALCQLSKVTSSILRALLKLNFIPVLIDQSLGSVTSSFGGDNEELTTNVAYFHTALALLLRICQTADGTQLVLNSGFFAGVTESKLFSTDPDIGLDIDNPVALREFYKLLSATLRVITAVVVARGPGNATVLEQAKSFLQQNRFSMQAVFKRTSAVQKTAGPPEKEAMDVADEFSKLLLVTDFLEDDETAHLRASRVNGFT